MSKKDFKGFCKYYEKIEPKTLVVSFKDYNNVDIRGFLVACQCLQNRYLEMADSDIFKD